MEIVIVICLLVVILLLLHDKIIINKVTKHRRLPENAAINLPDVMGRTKQKERLSVPNKASERQNRKVEVSKINFDAETTEEAFSKAIPEEELNEVFSDDFNLEEEEEDLKGDGYPNGDNGFATGVTFDELTTAGTLLQREMLEPVLQQKAVDIVQRIQGTELFSLLENSMEGASRKIAALMARSLPISRNSSSSDLREDDLSGFDIGEFV